LSGNPITEALLNELLDNVDRSMQRRLREMKDKSGEWEFLVNTLCVEFETRLDALLAQNGSRLHRLDHSQLGIVDRQRREIFRILENIYREV